MSRLIQTLIVLLLIALVPMRATASVAIGFNAADHQPAAAHAHDSAANDPLVIEHVEWARRKLSIDRD